MAEENHMKQGSAVSPQTTPTDEQNRRQQAESHARDREQRAERSGTRRSTKKLTPASRGTGGVWDDGKERLRTLKQDTDAYVRKNPAKAVFTALGIGFVLGLMRRR